MSSVREYSYKINGLALADDAIIEQIHDDFREVSGVIGINVKKEEEIIEYVLDQWSSDYDAFSKLSEICEKLSGKEDTWYATNIEICNYVNAYKSLVFCADRTTVYNPTLYEIWFYTNK